MEEKITNRIEELVKEINDLLSSREQHIAQVNKLEGDISAKQGAIFELKGLLDKKD